MSSQQAEGTGPSFNAEGLFIRFGDLLGPLVEEVGISPQALTDPDVLVPLDKHCRLLELAARPVVSVVDGGEDASESSTESRYQLLFDRVTEDLDRVVDAFVSGRRDAPPGSLLDVEA